MFCFRLKDEVNEKEEKINEAFERSLQPKKPKTLEQLLRKPKTSVLDKVAKKRLQVEKKQKKARRRRNMKKKKEELRVKLDQ